MVILWIILGLIGLVALLLHVPVCLHVVWDGGDPVVRLRYLFIAYTVYPSEQEEKQPGKLRQYISDLLSELKEKREERKKASQAQQKPREPEKSAWQSLRERRGFFGALHYLLRIVIQSASLAAYVVRRSVISRMKLHIAVGGDDAARIGVTQGQLCAVIYPVVSLVLCSVRRYRKCSVNIIPDFLSSENKYDIDIRMRVKPFHGLVGAVKMLVNLAKAEAGDATAEQSIEALKNASGEKRA